jgi:hypothetical protein
MFAHVPCIFEGPPPEQYQATMDDLDEILANMPDAGDVAVDDLLSAIDDAPTANAKMAKSVPAKSASAKPASAKPAAAKPAAAKPSAAKPASAKPVAAKNAANPASKAGTAAASKTADVFGDAEDYKIPTLKDVAKIKGMWAGALTKIDIPDLLGATFVEDPASDEEAGDDVAAPKAAAPKAAAPKAAAPKAAAPKVAAPPKAAPEKMAPADAD